MRTEYTKIAILVKGCLNLYELGEYFSSLQRLCEAQLGLGQGRVAHSQLPEVQTEATKEEAVSSG